MRLSGTLLFFAAVSLWGIQPIPFINPHPLSSAHFNPAMEGTKDRLEMTYLHASIFEDETNTYGGESFHRLIDYESSQLGIFYRTSRDDFSFMFNGELVYNHNGFLDNLIVWVHDRTGSTGGRWRERKEAPRNTYRFSVTDGSGNELIDDANRLIVRGALFAGYRLPWDASIRLGIKPPWEKEVNDFYPQSPEFSLSLQKAFHYGKLDMLMDASAIYLDPENSRIRSIRATANLLISYDGYYIQYNYVEPIFDEQAADSVLNTYGGVYVFGYRGEQFFWGIMEDFTLYNNPDVALLFGWEF